jgi:hypothetical protein
MFQHNYIYNDEYQLFLCPGRASHKIFIFIIYITLLFFIKLYMLLKLISFIFIVFCSSRVDASSMEWAAHVTPAANSWQSVTFGNDLFVAVAVSGTGNRV